MELKPCPFCGELPITRFSVSAMNLASGDMADLAIVCAKCGTQKTVRLKINGNGIAFSEINNAMENVMEVWNRRANDG